MCNHHFQRTHRSDQRDGQYHGLQNELFRIQTAFSIIIFIRIDICITGDIKYARALYKNREEQILGSSL